MRSKPKPKVLAWLDAQTAGSIYLSSVSLAELLLGIESPPVGKRRKALAAALDEQIIALFGERIVPFDLGTAGTYAKIVRRACQHRHPISVANPQIAAIAASRKFSVATRDETRSRPPGFRSSTPGPRSPTLNRAAGGGIRPIILKVPTSCLLRTGLSSFFIAHLA